MRFFLKSAALGAALCLTAGLLTGPALASPVKAVGRKAANAKIDLAVLGRYASGQKGGSEISAFSKENQCLFVINGNKVGLDVLDISNPKNPILFKTCDLTPYGNGVTSVAVHGKLVAAAVEKFTDKDKNIHAPGTIVVMDLDGRVQKTFPSGYLPDMVTFSPDGHILLAANEGEPSVGAAQDPKGSVTLVDLSEGLDRARVHQLGFEDFDAKFQTLTNRGVRLFPNGATVSQDLEPEYIAVTKDSKRAFVSLQENNAVAVIDLEKIKVVDIMGLGLKDWSRGLPEVTLVPFKNLGPLPDQAKDASPVIQRGGFSSLWFKGRDEKGYFTFYTTPDRGPNKPVKKSKPPQTIFPIPGYQHRIVEFKVNPQNLGDGAWISKEIPLFRQDGKTPITALPNLEHWAGEQHPLDMNGKALADGYDPLGGDMEGIVVDKRNHFWLVDEYRPSIYHFDPKGRLVDRFVPKGTAALGRSSQGTFGREALPEAYLKRKTNRGFEAAAYDPENDLVYAFIQSPLQNPDAKAGNTSAVIRILAFDPVKGKPVGEYVYFLENPGLSLKKTDKIGDAAYIGKDEFYVIERDATFSDPEGKKFIFRINLRYATNLLGKTQAALGGKTLEQLTPDAFFALGFKAASKIKVTNLPSIGYRPSDKAEGIAILPGGKLAVLNDNDFAYNYKNKTLKKTPEVLGIINFSQSCQIDVIKDKRAKLQYQSLYSTYMPDSIAAYETLGHTYFVTANEGDDRNDWYEDTAFVDAMKLKKKVALNPDYFPAKSTGARLKDKSNLRVSGIDGDINGDGKKEFLVAYGGRSFSIWDSFGNQVFDSGDQFERITARVVPDHFNASNSSNKPEGRTEKKGPEPEGVALGQINHRWYAFIGLERMGGLMVYDVTDPDKAGFVQYINPRNFGADLKEIGATAPGAGDLAPEGILFIPAQDSPIGRPLLVVCNEIRGTTTLYEISQH